MLSFCESTHQVSGRQAYGMPTLRTALRVVGIWRQEVLVVEADSRLHAYVVSMTNTRFAGNSIVFESFCARDTRHNSTLQSGTAGSFA